MTAGWNPEWDFPPGEYLRDEIEERGWTVSDLAEIIGRPVHLVTEILDGKAEIAFETACALARAFGTSPDLWLNLQKRHSAFKRRMVQCRARVWS